MGAKHLTMQELEAGLDEIRRAPSDQGVLLLIVRRPREEQRDTLEEAELSLTEGLVGDNWKHRGSHVTSDGSAHPEMQLNIMNARAIALLAQEKERWPLAGDQLFIDLNLSEDNLPPGTHLALGSAVIQVTSQPHLGCKKFRARFGLDAVLFVNSTVGKQMHLRGLNAKVITPGIIRRGDIAKKLSKLS
jgi:MOSC domain-containing protein YiiM